MMAPSPAATQPAQPAQAYPALKLPYGTGAIKENIVPVVDEMVGEFTKNAEPVYGALIGKPKSDLSSLDDLQMLLKDIVPGLKSVSDTYKTFGGDDYATQARDEPSPLPNYSSARGSPDPHPHPTKSLTLTLSP